MKQTPLTDMEGRWVHSTKESFDTLVAMGYYQYKGYSGYKKLEVLSNKYIFQGCTTNISSKQAYYHNGHFYDEPYEESEEKVPFPELEDIRIDATGGLEVFLPSFLESIKLNYIENIEIEEEYDIAKLAYENGVDVEWNLKPKIDRRLHKNRASAIAVGRWLDTNNCTIRLDDFNDLTAVSTTGKYFFVNNFYSDDDKLLMKNKIVLPDDFVFPEQVLQWMKEYEEEENV